LASVVPFPPTTAAAQVVACCQSRSIAPERLQSACGGRKKDVSIWPFGFTVT
jgi:hypothetical protein